MQCIRLLLTQRSATPCPPPLDQNIPLSTPNSSPIILFPRGCRTSNARRATRSYTSVCRHQTGRQRRRTECLQTFDEFHLLFTSSLNETWMCSCGPQTAQYFRGYQRLPSAWPRHGTTHTVQQTVQVPLCYCTQILYTIGTKP